MFQAEIDGRQEIFKALKDYGLRLNPPREEDLARLEELRRTLIAAWDERRTKLTQAHQLQQFKEQADQADSWLASKEAFLNNDDLGVSCFVDGISFCASKLSYMCISFVC